MKINKILAAGVAATLAVTSLSAVASAEEHIKTWPMGYTVKSGSANVDLLGYINKAYEDVEQAKQQLLVFELGNKATINGVTFTLKNDSIKSPKMTVTGLKETGLDAGGRPVYQTVTRDYDLVQFARQEPKDVDPTDGNEGKWSIAVLKDDEPTYKAGEFAPVYFDKITEVKVTYGVTIGDVEDKELWNGTLSGKKAVIDVGNVYQYDIVDVKGSQGKAEYINRVTWKEGDSEYANNLARLQAESAKVDTGAAATKGAVYVMNKVVSITDNFGNVYEIDAAAKNIKSFKDKAGKAYTVADGDKLKINNTEITLQKSTIGTDQKIEWTLIKNADGKAVAINVLYGDDATTGKIDGLNKGDIFEIPITEVVTFTNPSLTGSIKEGASGLEKVAAGKTYSKNLNNKKSDPESAFTLYSAATKDTVDWVGTDRAAATADAGATGTKGTGTYTAAPDAATLKDGDAANDYLYFVDGKAKVSVANTAAAILAYATVDGGWSPSVFQYTQPNVDVNWAATVKYPLLKRTTTDAVIKRWAVDILSETRAYTSETLNYDVDGNQTYKDDNKPEGTNPNKFAGLASQFGDFFNKQNNGTVTFKFTAKAASTDDWVIGGVPSTETGLKNALGTSSFGLFVNYNSSTGQLQTPGVVDNEALTVTFDVSEILNDMGGLTKGNVNDIYYGLNNGIDYGSGNIGYYVEEVTFKFDDAPAAVDAQTDDDADDDAAVVVADDDDDDVVADDDDDDIAEDDDIIEDDDDDDDAGEIIADDDDDDDDVNNEVDYVDADDDANPGTGVGLAVIPAIVAAAAAIVSKKRK